MFGQMCFEYLGQGNLYELSLEAELDACGVIASNLSLICIESTAHGKYQMNIVGY